MASGNYSDKELDKYFVQLKSRALEVRTVYLSASDGLAAWGLDNKVDTAVTILNDLVFKNKLRSPPSTVVHAFIDEIRLWLPEKVYMPSSPRLYTSDVITRAVALDRFYPELQDVIDNASVGPYFCLSAEMFESLEQDVESISTLLKCMDFLLKINVLHKGKTPSNWDPHYKLFMNCQDPTKEKKLKKAEATKLVNLTKTLEKLWRLNHQKSVRQRDQDRRPETGYLLGKPDPHKDDEERVLQSLVDQMLINEETDEDDDDDNE